VTDALAHGDLLVIWAQRGVLLALMVVVYAAARMRMGKRIEEA
jgi:hypothetical protein